ncbi:hypothetical protein [Bradyrhizobium sp.]|jgi:type II secretory pathway predicted ATPase ExeA|uniref:hypothetical protein n=1 Tax=Bradyrhizobium sp. TaxID=376 RepID=UPI003C232038
MIDETKEEKAERLEKLRAFHNAQQEQMIRDILAGYPGLTREEVVEYLKQAGGL